MGFPEAPTFVLGNSWARTSSGSLSTKHWLSVPPIPGKGQNSVAVAGVRPKKTDSGYQVGTVIPAV